MLRFRFRFLFVSYVLWFFYMQHDLLAGSRPSAIIDSYFTAGSGDYGRAVYGIALNNYFIAGDLELSDNLEFAQYRNSDSALLKNFSLINLMLGLKYKDDSVTGIIKSSHDKIEDSYPDLDYVVGYNHSFKMSSSTELAVGLWCTNTEYIWKNIPLVFPMLSVSTQYKDITIKFGILNEISWGNKKIRIKFVYVPVWTSNLSVRYNILPFLYTEVYSSTNCISVHSRKFDDKDELNLLSWRSGLRMGFYISSHASINLGGGFIPYSREWIGTSTSGIMSGRNLGQSFFGEIKASVFF